MEQQIAFMKVAIPLINSLSYVEKYCWWTTWFYTWGDWHLSLVNKDGTLNDFGKTYISQ